MKYSEKDIEFANQILTRRNELDNGLVEAWMSNPLHVEMLKEFVAIREEYTNWDFEIIKGEERERLQRAITRKKKRQLVMRWSVAASVILCVALSALYLWNDDQTFSARLELLQEQRRNLEEQQKQLQAAISKLDYKISRYEVAVKTGKLSWEENSCT